MQNFKLVDTQGSSSHQLFQISPLSSGLCPLPPLADDLFYIDSVPCMSSYLSLNLSLPLYIFIVLFIFTGRTRATPSSLKSGPSTSTLVSKCLLNTSVLIHCHVHLTFIKDRSIKYVALVTRSFSVPLMPKTEV